jgi:hypothetical protein
MIPTLDLANQIELAKFSFVNKHIYMCGLRESGKTTLQKNIFNAIADDVTQLFVVTNSPKKYSDLTDRVYSPVELDCVADYCLNDDNTNIKKVLIIDDVSLKKLDPDVYSNLLLNARHYNTTLIQGEQTQSKSNPEFTANVDYAFVSYQESKPATQRMYNSFFGFLESHAQYLAVNAALENKPGIFAFINKRNNPELSNILYFAKADPYAKAIKRTTIINTIIDDLFDDTVKDESRDVILAETNVVNIKKKKVKVVKTDDSSKEIASKLNGLIASNVRLEQTMSKVVDRMDLLIEILSKKQ